MPEGSTKTLGEMTKDEINQISHRGKAFEEFKEYLYRLNKWKFW